MHSFLDGTLRLRPPILDMNRTPGFDGWVQDGTLIKMYRVGANEGVSTSVASLSAPADAKKQYELGEAAAAKRKWPQAEEQFRAALSIYPQYAMASSELGEALREEGRLDDAVEAYQKALQADPQYLKPLVQLAQVSSMQRHWDNEKQFSERALKKHSVDFPAVLLPRGSYLPPGDARRSRAPDPRSHRIGPRRRMPGVDGASGIDIRKTR
jgi:tetratricopeptide (TPR) repeat protein